MNTALVTIASLSLACSAGSLLILVKMAKELKTAKDEVDTLKVKVAHNAKVVKTALGAMEL